MCPSGQAVPALVIACPGWMDMHGTEGCDLWPMGWWNHGYLGSSYRDPCAVLGSLMRDGRAIPTCNKHKYGSPYCSEDSGV